jgi:4-hydroxybenzoate polyprenyltransferase
MNILPFVLIYTAFAFLTTLIREIVKDAEDYDGDFVTYCRTIPIVCGMLKTKVIVGVLSFVLYVFLAYFHWVLARLQADTAIYIMIVAETLGMMILPILFNIKEFADFHRLSIVLKMIMVVGMLTMVFI